MKSLLLSIVLLVPCGLAAKPFTLHIVSPDHAHQAVVLYRYDDLFTLRTVRLADAVLDGRGHAVLKADVVGTTKGMIRIGDAVADLFMRPDLDLHVHFPLPSSDAARSLNGKTRVVLTFQDLDRMDINALTTDVNERIDDFITTDLATDEAAGMQALEVYRQGTQQVVDTVRRPPTLFIMPNWSALRLDSFETKLRHFYREVDDPWFMHYMEYALGGMRQGPRANDQELHARYLRSRTIAYDDPEYVRFLRGFFAEHLNAEVLRFHEADLKRTLELAEADSVKALFARHDFLKDEDRLCELVMIDQLYLNSNARHVPHRSLMRIMDQIATRSAYAEHRLIASNMHWDLSAMHASYPLPDIRLEDLRGRDVDLDTLLAGPVCIAITAAWCTYCELEMVGLEKLHQEYQGIIPIIAISLDPSLDDVKRYLRKHPGRDFRWLHAVAEQQLREDLRLRSLPAFFLLNDGVLVSSPAPMPSTGLGALFHRAKVGAEKEGGIKVWDE